MSEYKVIGVRIPLEIYELVKKQAIEERRSMNQQVVVFIENELKEREIIKRKWV